MDEFVGRFIEKFKSRYDLIERKDRLGERGDQTIDIYWKVTVKTPFDHVYLKAESKRKKVERTKDGA